MSDLEFGAFYFDGRSSRAHPVRVRFDGRRLRVAGEGVSARGQRGRCRVNPPLGQARRVIRLPEEGRLETDDRQAVERLEAWLGLNRGLTRVHRLEGQFFGPSELPAARQRGFEATFARIARDVGGGIATGSSSAAPPSSAPTPSPCPQASSSSPTTWCTWPKTTASS